MSQCLVLSASPRNVCSTAAFRNHSRSRGAPVMRTVVPKSVSDDDASDVTSRRATLATVLSLPAAALMLPRAAYAKSVAESKRKTEERKRHIREAAEQARTSGVGLETELTSDYSLPEGQQRGRNSRTVPQK